MKYFIISLIFLLYSANYTVATPGSRDAASIDEDSLLIRTLSDDLDRKYTYNFLEGVAQKNNGRIDDAFLLFEHCTELNNLRPEAYYELAKLYMNSKQVDKGIEFFKRSVELDSLNYWYNESLFFALYSSPSRSEDATRLLERMTQRFPSKSSLQFQLLEMYNLSQDYDKVILGLNKLEKSLGKSEHLSMQKFRTYLLMGDEKKAFDEIDALIKVYPDEYRYQVILADLYLNKGKKKQTLSILRRVLANDPDNPLAIYSLANYYYESNDLEKYIFELHKILNNSKVDSTLKLNLLRQLIMKTEGDRDSVIPVFEKAIAINSNDDQIMMLYTQYLVSQNMRIEAKPVLERIISIDPTNTPSRLMLLALAIEKDDYLAVIELCEGGILASPETLEFYYYLAIAYNQAEKYDKIIRVVNQALEIVDSSTPTELISDFYAIKGDAYHGKGDHVKMYECYDLALQHSPKNYAVLNNYAYYLSVDKMDLYRAEEMSKKTVDAEPNNPTFLDTYAWILFELKKYTQARIFIDTALDNGGDQSGVIVEHAGDIYYKIGEKERALEYWIEADKLGASSNVQQKIKQKKYLVE